MEIVIVKVIRNKKIINQENFKSYDEALDFAMRQSWRGYTTLILRNHNNKWIKSFLNPDIV